MADTFVRLGLSLTVIAIISLTFYQVSNRPAAAVPTPGFGHHLR